MSASRPPVLLIVAAVVFVAFLGLLLAQSLAPKRIETFVLGDHPPRAPEPGRTDTVTLDVRDAALWHYLDLDRGALLVPPDTQGWDLAARRFQLRVPSVGHPANGQRPTANGSADLPRWYRYDFLAHLLRPAGQTYVLQTDLGTEVTLEVLGYYCPGPTAGCLTVRYSSDSVNSDSSRSR
jgi:hypothetical protein